MTAHFLASITDGSVACLTCGCGAHPIIDMDRVLAVGFGECDATKDGHLVYAESDRADGDWLKVQDIESMAASEPDADWRIQFIAPLYEAEYQRQGDAHWVLVRKGQGFA